MAECSCRGRNPNCFKCGGLGAASLVEPGRPAEKSYADLLSSLASIAREPGRRRAASSQFRSSQSKITCSLCGTLVNAQNLARHNRKVHSGTQSTAKVPARSRPQSRPITRVKTPRAARSGRKSNVLQRTGGKRSSSPWFVQGGLCNGR